MDVGGIRANATTRHVVAVSYATGPPLWPSVTGRFDQLVERVLELRGH